jgi:hypothetical protein
MVKYPQSRARHPSLLRHCSPPSHHLHPLLPHLRAVAEDRCRCRQVIISQQCASNPHLPKSWSTGKSPPSPRLRDARAAQHAVAAADCTSLHRRLPIPSGSGQAWTGRIGSRRSWHLHHAHWNGAPANSLLRRTSPSVPHLTKTVCTYPSTC